MKLHIFGASGSGVTTLGQTLANKLHVAYFDSDDYFWEKTEQPFTTKRNPIERNKLIMQDISKVKKWILGGSIIQWSNNLFPSFDLVVFLYLPAEIRIERLKKREYERYGEVIYTNPNRAKQFNTFLTWATDYDNNTGIASRTLQAHQTWLRKIKSPILNIIGDLTTAERIKVITDLLTEEKLLPTSAYHNEASGTDV